MNEKQTEALKLALEALLINCGGNTEGKGKEAITAISEALTEQPAQTATYTCGVCGVSMQMEQPAQQHECSRSHPHENMDAMCELRTEIARLTNENARLKAQPSKPWLGLSTVELDEIDAPIRERRHATIAEIYRAIEAKLREKNELV